MAKTLYEQDFYAWANQQAALLRAGKLSEMDIDHIAEEIESMGRSEKRELISCLSVLLHHLLKWQFQSELRHNSWLLTIEEQRQQLIEHLQDNPSLRATLAESIAKAFNYGVIAARRETGLPRSTFPSACPYPEEQIFDLAFYPEPKQ